LNFLEPANAVHPDGCGGFFLFTSPQPSPYKGEGVFLRQKNNPRIGSCFLVRLVPTSLAATATESASRSAEVLAARPVAFLTIDSAVCSVIALGWLERELFDCRSALGASQVEFGAVKKLSLRTILIVHFSFCLIC